MGVEPEDFCRECDKLFPMSELHKHVAEGSCRKKKKHSKRNRSSFVVPDEHTVLDDEADFEDNLLDEL